MMVIQHQIDELRSLSLPAEYILTFSLTGGLFSKCNKDRVVLCL